MLSKKSVYCIVSLLAIISLPAVDAIAIDSKQSRVFPAFSNYTVENRIFAGGLDPKMLKEQQKAEVNTIDLRSGRHDEYLRVVLEGPHEIISAGKVRHRAHVVSVTFSDANFSLRENNVAVPFRREHNKVVFTQNNLEKIRVHNLSKPDRLAIDFYIKKAGSDQQKGSRTEIVNKQKAVAMEKIQLGSNNMDQKMAEQKEEMLARTSIPAVEVQEPVSLIIPSITVGDSKSDSEGEVKQTDAEEFDTISKKEGQKTVDKNLAEPDEKAVPQVMETAPAKLMVSNMPEVKGLPEKAVENLLDTSSIHEKTSPVTERSIIKELDHRGIEPDIEASNLKEQSKSEPEPRFPPVESSENVVPVIIADVKKETVRIERDDVKDNVTLPSVRDVTETDVQTNDAKRKIALLPFDNFSNNNDALDNMMPLIQAQLKDRGYDVLGYEEVDAYLCEKRIRQSSFMSRKVATELGKNKMVNTVMAGAVLTFTSGENPKIGILARLLDISTGQIIWSDFVSLTGEDFTKVLGLGTIKSMDLLIPRALDRLFAKIDRTSPNPGNNDLYKIAVLPFKNASKHRHAGKIITHLFQNELSNNPMFDPVDFGDIRQNIINLRIGRKGEVDYNNLQALSKSLGVDAVLTGTVEEYRSGQSYASPPSVTISARLLDSRRNRILWYDNLHLDGEENIIALDWGRLRSADKVAYGAVSGLVENIKTEGLLQ